MKIKQNVDILVISTNTPFGITKFKITEIKITVAENIVALEGT